MKLKIASTLLLATCASFAFMAFAPKADVYKLDPAKSTITWEGKKLGGLHTGTLIFKEGSLAFTGKTLSQGNFIVNMTSLKDDGGSAGLEKHLKTDEFFGTEQFPEASFVIKKVTGNGALLNITGDLTIKGKTNPITFQAKVTWNKDQTITATADQVVIDRTKFGVQYGSKSVFPNLGDKFIYDEFTLGIKIIAKKG